MPYMDPVGYNIVLYLLERVLLLDGLRGIMKSPCFGNPNCICNQFEGSCSI